MALRWSKDTMSEEPREYLEAIAFARASRWALVEAEGAERMAVVIAARN